MKKLVFLALLGAASLFASEEFQKACDGGDWDKCVELGIKYYKGDGVDGHVWGQRVGVDPYPVLNGAGVEGYEGGRTVASVKVSPVNLSVAVDGRKVNVAGARVGDRIAVFDLQGKAVPGFDSHVTSGNFELTMPRTGRYLLMVGKRVMPVTVK